MKFKDLVANSLPRVRGRKSKKSTHAHNPPHISSSGQKPEFSTCPRYFPQHPVLDSRESSVERSSTVAVVDAPWRDNAVYKCKGAKPRHADLSLTTQPLTYYTPAPAPAPQHGMVMSHSADAISSQATMAVLMTSSQGYQNGSKVTTRSDHYSSGLDYQHHNISAISETAVNYIGPNCFYHSQHQHQHHHHHNHNHHYVYHHHHHRHFPNQSQNLARPAPLTEKNQQQVSLPSNTEAAYVDGDKPKKSGSSGFLRKSFASFRAMRKQVSRAKDQEGHQNPACDENDKCLVCPYPQPQSNDRNSSDRKQSKQSRKGLKGLKKSKKQKSSSAAANDYQSDKSWYSDNDTQKIHPSHAYNLEAIPYSNFQQFPVRECSMEGSIPRHHGTRSREGSSIRELDPQCQETVSLSGYDSDVSKNRAGRSRSRIKTNPWLPSPQPSLTMGRRFENCHQREPHDDAMDEDITGCFPKSASFDYHSQLGVSSFQSSFCQEDSRRSIQRHRSLTPVDLKLNLSHSLPRAVHAQSSFGKEDSVPRKQTKETDKNHFNDLNTNSTKSRPSSIVSPNSEFMALADNIEQLANNISFEYEEACGTPIDGDSTPVKDGDLNAGENCSKKRKSDSNGFPLDDLSDNAHSPDSGIACLSSCDGDEAITMSSAAMLTASPTFESSPGPDASSQNACVSRDASGSVSANPRPAGTKNENINSCHSSNSITKDGVAKRQDVFKKCSRGQSGACLPVSSSNESLNSGIISESDIDNTSYKYAENFPESSIITDSPKPLNSCGYLMVEERLDVDFQSLPRKCKRNAKTTIGQRAVSRSHTISLPMEKENGCGNTPLSSREGQKVKKSKTKQPFTFSGQRHKNSVFSSGQEKEETSAQNALKNRAEFQAGLSMLDSSCDSNVTLVVSLDSKVSNEVKDEAMNGLELEAHSGSSGVQSNESKDTVDSNGCVGMDMTFTPDDAGSHAEAETVDACVQTDFYDDFETWERRQPSQLPHLDDSFDPVESTRRWLMCGNMQGSADTGYSSQPRDSHVFMDEEASMLQLDALSDKGASNFHQLKNKSSPIDECPAPDLHTKTLNAGVKAHDGVPRRKCQNSLRPSDCALSQQLLAMESPFHDAYDHVIRKRPGVTSDDTKRHSSDSSTSTLTSDVPGCAEKEDLSSLQCEEELDALYRKSSKVVKVKRDIPEHDYVNIPRVSKHQTHFSSLNATEDGKTKLSSGNKSGVQKKSSKSHAGFPYILPLDSEDAELETKDSDMQRQIFDTSLGSFQCVENLSHIDQDKADYLEFLRDAPLKRDRSKTPVFIIPGFGPIELSFELQEACLSFINPGGKGNVYHMGDLKRDNKVDCKTNDGSHNKRASQHSRSKNQGDVSVSSVRSKSIKTSKPKREEKHGNPMALSQSCPNAHPHTADREFETVTKSQSCHLPSGKRKSHHTKDAKTNRCPTMQSYDVDSFPAGVGKPNSLEQCRQCPESSPQALKADMLMRDNSARSLAERVALLRREKDIIYRKIQEVQEQELSRQREQLQQQRHLHCQRKEELLETLQDLKEKLEEQSKKLQQKYCEEI